MPFPPQPFYFDTITFQTATDVWLDAALTSPAPDGYYAQSGIYREKSGGVLGPVQTCPTCALSCNTSLSASAGAGMYRLTYDVGNSTGAVVIQFSPMSIPDKLTWTHDGTSASEYSSILNGYAQGLIGTVAAGAALPDPITNANGSNGATYSGLNYAYDNSTGTFISSTPTTIGPYTNALAGGVTLDPTNQGYHPITFLVPNPAVMVVPKINSAVTTVDMTIEGPGSSTQWDLVAYCPTQLNMFHNGPAGGTCSTINSSIFTCSVDPFTNGTSNLVTGNPVDYLTVNDWVFSDQNGVNQLAAGVYPVQEPSSGLTKCITVSGDGIITNITTCAGSC